VLDGVVDVGTIVDIDLDLQVSFSTRIRDPLPGSTCKVYGRVDVYVAVQVDVLGQRQRLPTSTSTIPALYVFRAPSQDGLQEPGRLAELIDGGAPR
jgi:hypothetical protein